MHEWRGLALIFALGLLAGLVTWLASSSPPSPCYLTHIVNSARPYFTWVCDQHR